MRSEREIIDRIQDIEERMSNKFCSIAGKKSLQNEKYLLHWVLEKRDDKKPNTDDLLKDILFEMRKITTKE